MFYSFIRQHLLERGSTDSSVGRVSDSCLQGRGLNPLPGCGVVSLSKTLHPHRLVLLRKPSQND